MAYIICLSINLKNTGLSYNYDVIMNAANNTYCNSIYTDYELEGINNYIKKNKMIIVIEYDLIDSFLNFLKFIIKIRDISIDYIYYDNTIIYYSIKYINSMDKTINNTDMKKKIKNSIESNKYNDIYKILKII